MWDVRAGGGGNGGALPAVALTVIGRAEDRLRALRASYQMHVAKPVEPAELVAVVASVSCRLRANRVRCGNPAGDRLQCPLRHP